MSGTIRVFNTLGRALEPLVPRDPGRIGMYVCGPTVQSEPHLGHGRSAVVFDVVRRYLVWRGFEVTFVRNITDIEDKIIAAAAASGETTDELATRISSSFAAAYDDLGVLAPDVEPRATAHIPEMIDLVAALIERDVAYPAENGDVYFSVRRFDGYGKLSGHRPDELLSGARVEISEAKRDPLDFALWKAAKAGEPSWDSPWGAGRPGWHIECSAMARRYLGDGFDIHGGGADLIFPHHENEIAQSEAATGQPLARYWLHNGMVNLGGEKMAKSTGHVVELRAAIDRFGGPAVRLFYLRAHYRSPLEFSDALISESAESLGRLRRLLERAPAGDGRSDPEVMGRFTACMDEDFATSEALGILFEAARDANRALDAGEPAAPLVAAVTEIAGVLGLDVAFGVTDLGPELAELAAELGLDAGGEPAAVIERLVGARQTARADRRFEVSDLIRARLAEVGIVVEDTADGPRWIRR